MATILIVDDDTLIRDTLHEFLSEKHECHTADRAEQALACLEVQSYDAVITDVSMPGLTGREILMYVQNQHPTTPVIVISGKPDGADGKSLVEMGAFAYFTKPFQLDDIEDTVTRAIARHQEFSATSTDP
jgi:DNA-binding NtrC family response regulator